MENHYPYLIFNQNKSDNEFSSDSERTKNKNFQFQPFMKFKSKQNNDQEEEDKINTLKGAEFKVKSLLSDFIKNMNQEKMNENKQPKLKNHLSLFHRKGKKRNTVITKMYSKTKNELKSENEKKSLFKKNKSNISNISTIMQKKKSIRKNTTDEIYETNTYKNKYLNIKDKKSFDNQSNNSKISPKRKYENEEKSFNKDFLNNSNNKSLNSLLNSNNPINENISPNNENNNSYQKEELFNKILEGKKKKSRNDLFNESFHNSIISEGSGYNIIHQKSADLKKDQSNQINSSAKISSNNNRLILNNPADNISLSVKKENTMKNSKVEYKKVINKGSKTNTNQKKDFQEHQFLNKILKKNSDFNDIKEKLKQTLILRPEDLDFSPRKLNNMNSIHSKSNKKNISNEIQKEKTNMSSIQNKYRTIVNKTLNTINLGYINKDDLFRRSNSNIDKKPSQFSEKNFLKKTKKTTTENETEKTLKTTTKTTKKANCEEEIPKKNIYNVFSKNAIQRKQTKHLDKFRILQHKPMVYDSLDDEEIEDENDGRRIYLDPNSNFVLIFDGTLFIISIISFVVTPLYIAFNHDFCRPKKLTLMSSFNIITEILYILDLCLGFFRAYYNWEEQLICRHRSIIKKYLSEWFILDLFSAIPIYIINKLSEPVCNDNDLHSTYYNVILNNKSYLFISNRLLKLIKVLVDNQALKTFSNKIADRYKIIFTIFSGISALNYSACLYIFIARNSYPNWILKSNLNTKNFFHIYICSIYIIIMALTTVGYGDITCYSLNERIYQLFLLIVGIMAYSYSVTAFSNFVQKINEKSADYSKKKTILDEIKMANHNMPQELYERILKYLNYKYKHEKKYKNLIFDSLPVTLKNDLISEMYKPIIKNFIFFKNFHNKDFIVRVILAFKAIIAYKNDILVTEGDLLEDIMFVKKGALSVELPINISNPQKNIDRYLNRPLLKEKTESNIDNISNDFGSWLSSNRNNRRKSKNINNKKSKNQDIHSTSIIGSYEASKIHLAILTDKKKFNEREKSNIPDEIRYVKILGIRNNEHFGDVLMFLEKRSPLRLRVRTKKCELFFLKKIDAIKISNDHPTIWRNINKKSIYNFEQIKKCIVRIVEIYCSVKRLKSISEKSSLYENVIHETEKDKEKSSDNSNHNCLFNNSSFQHIKEFNLFRSQSVDYEKNNNYFEEIFKKNKIDFQNYKINYKFKSYSLKNIERKYNINELYNPIKKLEFNSSYSSEITNNKKSNKYQQQQKNSCKKVSIKNINNKNKYKKSLPQLSKKKLFSKSDKKVRFIPLKKEQKDSLGREWKNAKKWNTNNLHSSNKSSSENSKIINNNIRNLISNKESSFSKTLKLNESSSYNIFLEENKENNRERLIDSNTEEEDNEITVNKEIIPGEEIKINKENTLFTKKYNQSNLNDLNNAIINNALNVENNNVNNDIEYKNTKIKLLLNSFIKENNLEEIKNNINNDEKLYKKKKFCKLSVNKNISLVIEPCYENCNLITREKLINNKNFQEKLKQFLLNESLNLISFSSERFNRVASLSESNNKVKMQNFKEKSSPLKKQKYNNRKSTKSLNIITFQKKGTPIKKKTLIRSSSFNENHIQKNQKNKIKFKDEFMNNDITTINNVNNNNANKKVGIKRIFTSNKDNCNSSLKLGLLGNMINSNEMPYKKLMSKKTTIQLFQNNIKSKKINDSALLLSQIDLNIEKTNQKLNNPNEFYSNYFNYLLEEKIIGKNNRIHHSEIFRGDTEQKKDKTIKKGNTLRRISNKKI